MVLCTLALLESVGPSSSFHSLIAFCFPNTITIMSLELMNATRLGKNIFP